MVYLACMASSGAYAAVDPKLLPLFLLLAFCRHISVSAGQKNFIFQITDVAVTLKKHQIFENISGHPDGHTCTGSFLGEEKGNQGKTFPDRAFLKKRKLDDHRNSSLKSRQKGAVGILCGCAQKEQPYLVHLNAAEPAKLSVIHNRKQNFLPGSPRRWISSRKRIPPSAWSISPVFFSIAPVKAPFSWPKSWDRRRDPEESHPLNLPFSGGDSPVSFEKGRESAPCRAWKGAACCVPLLGITAVSAGSSGVSAYPDSLPSSLLYIVPFSVLLICHLYF